MSKGRHTLLPVSELVLHPDLQPRAHGTSQIHANELAAAVRAKAKLPRVQVRAVKMEDGSVTHFVTDGFHTVEGHTIAGRKMVAVTVKDGVWEDAVLEAAAANQKNLALTRTPEDKRRAVEMVLGIHPEWTSRRIGQHIGVSHPFVEGAREALETLPQAPQKTVRVGKDGRKVATRKPRAEPAMESDDWRTFPIAELVFDGDDDSTKKLLDGHDLKTAGDIASALESGCYPDGKPMRNKEYQAMLLRAIAGLAGYDGPMPRVEKEAEGGGKVVGFDWREWERHFGPVARALDDIGRLHPAEKRSLYFKSAMQALSAYATGMKEIRKRLEATEAK